MSFPGSNHFLRTGLVARALLNVERGHRRLLLLRNSPRLGHLLIAMAHHLLGQAFVLQVLLLVGLEHLGLDLPSKVLEQFGLPFQRQALSCKV